jgi:hypothetical protein
MRDILRALLTMEISSLNSQKHRTTSALTISLGRNKLCIAAAELLLPSPSPVAALLSQRSPMNAYAILSIATIAIMSTCTTLGRGSSEITRIRLQNIDYRTPGAAVNARFLGLCRKDPSGSRKTCNRIRILAPDGVALPTQTVFDGTVTSESERSAVIKALRQAGVSASFIGANEGRYTIIAPSDNSGDQYLVDFINRPENLDYRRAAATLAEARIFTDIVVAFGHNSSSNRKIAIDSGELARQGSVRAQISDSDGTTMVDGTVFAYEIRRFCWDRQSQANDPKLLLLVPDRPTNERKCPRGQLAFFR